MFYLILKMERVTMLEYFDRFFGNREDHHRLQAAQTQPMNLPDDALLVGLLETISQTSSGERYPLQINLYEKLMSYDLILPIPAGAISSQGIPILALENARGEKALPVFSSEEALELWSEDKTTECIGLAFPRLCAYAVESGIDYLVINVSGPHGCEIPFQDFNYLAQGLLPPPAEKQDSVTVAADTPISLAVSQGLPALLHERLQDVFRHHRALIQQVYLFDIAFNNGPLQQALGIRMPDGLETYWELELWPTLQAVLHEMLDNREVVNVFLLNHSGHLEAHVRELTPPLYETCAYN